MINFCGGNDLVDRSSVSADCLSLFVRFVSFRSSLILWRARPALTTYNVNILRLKRRTPLFLVETRPKYVAVARYRRSYACLFLFLVNYPEIFPVLPSTNPFRSTLDSREFVSTCSISRYALRRNETGARTKIRRSTLHDFPSTRSP